MKTSRTFRGSSAGALVFTLGLAACSDDPTDFLPSVDASTFDARVAPRDGSAADASCKNAFAGCAFDAEVPGRDAGAQDAERTDDAEPVDDADVGSDAAPDAAVEGGVEGGVEAGVEGGVEAGPDAAPEAGVDAGPLDSGADAGLESGVDAATDAGVDAGPDAAVTCDVGRVLCAGACIDPNTSASFCGASGDCSGRLGGAACSAAQICGNGACTTLAPKRIFVTSGVFPASRLQSAASADAQCQRVAPARPAGTFKAWLSDATSSPSTRFSRAGNPYRLVDGTTVAENWAGLTSGTLKAAITLTERNGAPANGTLATATTGKAGGPFNVFTGTNADGTNASLGAVNYTCQNWTSAATTAAVAVGASTATGPGWSNGLEGLYCADTASLYCVEQ